MYDEQYPQRTPRDTHTIPLVCPSPQYSCSLPTHLNELPSRFDRALLRRDYGNSGDDEKGKEITSLIHEVWTCQLELDKSGNVGGIAPAGTALAGSVLIETPRPNRSIIKAVPPFFF